MVENIYLFLIDYEITIVAPNSKRTKFDFFHSVVQGIGTL